MKQNISVSWLLIRLGLFLLFYFVPQSPSVQEKNGSIRITRDSLSLEPGGMLQHFIRGDWETVPIMIPYYRFNKFTLGLDVGGILYEILRDVVFDKNRDMHGGPTIAPPRLQIPIR